MNKLVSTLILLLCLAGAGFSQTAEVSPIDIGKAKDLSLSRIANSTLAVGNGTQGDFTGTIKFSLAQFGGSDVGISRCGAGIACIGNGTAGSTAGIAQGNQFVGFQGGGQALAGFSVQTVSGVPGYSWKAGGAGTDQKWWDLIVSGNTSLQGRLVNDANTSAVNWLTVNRGTGTALSSISLGNFSIPIVTDTAVGRATTDTLSNKTLQSAASGNSVTLLNEQGPGSTLTGNAADQVVFTYTLPGNVMQAGKGIRITAFVNHTTGIAAVTYKLNFGGTTYTTVTPTDTAIAGEMLVAAIFNNSGVTNAQHGSAIDFFGGTVAIGTTVTSAVDTTSAVTVSITFNAANTQQVQGRQFLVELIQ